MLRSEKHNNLLEFSESAVEEFYRKINIAFYTSLIFY